MLLHSLDDGTARFVGVGTVGELAVLRKLENFLEIAGEFLLLDIKGTEALDARSINEIDPFRQLQHLAEGMSWLMRVDLPTPLLPLSSDFLSRMSGRNSSTPSPVAAEISTHW